jgi:hypothetical protein
VGIGVARVGESTKHIQSIFEEMGRRPVVGARGVEGADLLKKSRI